MIVSNRSFDEPEWNQEANGFVIHSNGKEYHLFEGDEGLTASTPRGSVVVRPAAANSVTIDSEAF